MTKYKWQFAEVEVSSTARVTVSGNWLSDEDYVYSVFGEPMQEISDPFQHMAQMGQDGWELVSVTHDRQDAPDVHVESTRYFFKRPL